MLPHVLQVSEVATECCDDQADVDAVVGLKARDAVRQFKFRLLDSVSVAPPWCTVKPSKGDKKSHAAIIAEVQALREFLTRCCCILHVVVGGAV